MLQIAVEAIDNIKTVKALGCESVFCDSYETELEFCKQAGFKRSHFRSIVIGTVISAPSVLSLFMYNSRDSQKCPVFSLRWRNVLWSVLVGDQSS